MRQTFYPAKGPAWMRLVRVGFGVLVGLAVLTGAFVVWAPTDIDIRVTRTHLEVRSKLGFWGDPLRVPLEGIDRIEVIELQPGWRVRGTGRFDYCEGIFRYPNTGDVQQATRCRSRVVLVTHPSLRRPIVVEPADPGALVAAVSEGRPSEHPAALPRDAPGWWVALRSVVFVLVPIFLILMFRANLVYVVDENRLRIKGPLGWSTFELAGRRAYRHSPKRLWRTFGAGMPGYWVGRFRGDGKALRVWATRRSEGVVVEGDPRVWVTPEDPDAFLTALAEGGANVGPSSPEADEV